MTDNHPNTSPGLRPCYSVRELYEISRGRREEWGIDGYHVPKTIQYLRKPFLFPKDKRKDAFSMALKREKWPDPAKHSPEPDKYFKSAWLSKGGRIPKGPKKTIIDEVMKKEKDTPGPCSYFKDLNKKKVPASTDQSKRIRDTFLNTVEAMGLENPAPGKYDPKPIQSRSTGILWIKPKDGKKKEKEKVGPGCYENYMKAKNFTLPSPFQFSVPKAKSPDTKETKGKTTRSILPGVGQYSDVFFNMSLGGVAKKLAKSGKGPISKSKRYLDEIIRLGKTVPGPGTYEVGPPGLNEKKI